MTLKLKLTALKGKGAGTVYRFPLPGAFVGSEKDNDLCIEEDGISKYHAGITFKDGKWLLKDLNSSNGTKVNGVEISKETELKPKDVLHFANSAFRFEIDESDLDLPDPLPEKNDEPCIKIRSPEEARKKKVTARNEETDGIDDFSDYDIDEEEGIKHRKRHSAARNKYCSDAAHAQVRVMRRMSNYAYEQKKKRLGRFILLITIIINILIFYYWYVYIYAPSHKGKKNVIKPILEKVHLRTEK